VSQTWADDVPRIAVDATPWPQSDPPEKIERKPMFGFGMKSDKCPKCGRRFVLSKKNRQTFMKQYGQAPPCLMCMVKVMMLGSQANMAQTGARRTDFAVGNLITHALRLTARIMLVIILATATSTFARLGDTQKEFEQANPDFKYAGESPGNLPNTKVRQYQRDGKVAQVVFGGDGKVIMEAYSDLSGKIPESSLVPVAKSYGYEFSALQKQSVSVPWKGLVLHRDFWFSPDHKFCIGIADVIADVAMNDSKIVSTMTVAGEQVARSFDQNSTEKRSDAPAKMPTTMVNAALIIIWIGCVIVCFLKWKTWTAIFGIIGLIVANLPTTGTNLHYLIMGPFTSLALLVVAIRLAKPVSWWAKWFYWGPMGSDRRLLNPSPKLARAFARFPEQKTEFDQPEPASK
jgi:hypothetical protein